jgi:hypothetical protein
VTHIVEELGAFAAVGGSGNFAECAAERDLLVFQGGAYFPETFYRSHHPFVWNTAMECERISAHVAEYIGKRLAGKPAKHAGAPELAGATRAFATYVPDNDGYQRCANITEATLQSDYDVAAGPRYNYQLDISRFQQQAQEAVIQFKAAGVTTLVLACDPFSTIFLTQAADAQDWHPEWLLIGVAGTDTDNFGRSYSASQIEGHMFGLSQLSDSGSIFGSRGEPGQLWKKLEGTDIPKGTTGDFYSLVHIYNFLQAQSSRRPTSRPACRRCRRSASLIVPSVCGTSPGDPTADARATTPPSTTPARSTGTRRRRRSTSQVRSAGGSRPMTACASATASGRRRTRPSIQTHDRRVLNHAPRGGRLGR